MRLLTSAPFPRRRPVFGLAALLLLLIAGFVLATTAGPAQAQTTVKLVSNTGQSSFSSDILFHNTETSFTTGSHTGGYMLKRVDLVAKTGTGSETPSVTIREGTRTGTSLGTLTIPTLSSSFTTAQFTAPGGGFRLKPSTTYVVVLTGSSTVIDLTDSASEDSGAAAGWSIADSNRIQGSGVDASIKMAIHGYANSAPTVANAIPDQRVEPGTAFTYTFPANTFADTDTGDTLTYTATKSDGTALPSWLTFTASTRTFSGTPQTANAGTLSVKVTASDGTASVSDTFDIVVSTAPTVANPLEDTTALEGRPFLHVFPANTFADAEGDTLTYTATRSNGTPLPSSWSWLHFTASTRTFYGTPRSDNVGTLSVRVTAADPGGRKVSDTFNIVVKASNTAPTVAYRIPNQSATTGSAFSYTFPSGTFAPASSGNALTYTATRWSGSPLPSWLTFNAGTRTFSGTPQPSNVGKLVVRVTASDGTASVSDIFDIIVANSSTPLVSNTGKASDAQLWSDIAQTFTTGPNQLGYTLTEVQLDVKITAGSLPSYQVEIWSANASNHPNVKLGTLTKPSTLATGLNSFTSASGIQLTKDTKYVVVIDRSSVNSVFQLQHTNSNGEDSGRASGWGIWDNAFTRVPTSTDGYTSIDQSLKMAVHGYSNTRAQVNGKTLTMTFDDRLEEGRVPAGDAFKVLGPGARRFPVSEVSISGKSVTLTLEKPIGSHVKWAAVEYHPGDAYGPDNTGLPLARRPSSNVKQDNIQWDFYQLHYFSLNVSILTPDTPPVVQRLTVSQSIRPENQHLVLFTSLTAEDLPVERWSDLVVVLNEPVDPSSLPAGSAFRVTARAPGGGSAVTVSGTGTAGYTDPDRIHMRLAQPVARGAEVTVSYVKPSTNPPRDLTGNALESFSGMAATNVDRGMAKAEVVSVAVVSDPGPDRTYRPDEQIQVQVTFSGDVVVSGTPRLRFNYYLYADYESGDGTRTLTFAYTVRELDRSSGIVVDGLELNGGAITSWAHPGAAATNPDLSQVRLGYDANHKMDGRLPVFQSAAVDGTALTVTFDENLDTGSAPAPGAFYVTVNNARRNVASGGVAISGATVTLTLASAVTHSDTVKVRYLKPSSNPLQNSPNRAVETFADQAVTNNTQGTIWSADLTVGAAVTGGWGCWNGIGTECSSVLTEDGERADSFTTGGTTYRITRILWLTAGANDVQSLSIGLDKTLPLGLVLYVDNRRFAIADATLSNSDKAATWTNPGFVWSNNQQVSLSLTAPGGSGGPSGQSAQTIPPTQPVAEPAILVGPSVTGVSVVSGAGPDQTYGLGDTIQVRVTFAGPVDVTGAPRIKIDMDPAEWGEKWAAYDRGSGTASLTFTHTVVEPNISTQGIALLANTLELNGGTIQSDGADADLSHTGLSHDSNHKVDWQTAGEESGAVGQSGGDGQDGSEEEQSDPASVSGLAVSSSPQANATYKLGETIQVTLTFSEAVDVAGTPRLKIDMDPADGGEMWAGYASGSGTATLTFTHTVVEPNISTQGIAVLANTLALNGGDIESKDSDTDADLPHTGLAHDSDHKVDWRLPLASVTGVSVTSDPGSDDTYANGDVITITLTFSKAVNVDTSGGAPRLKIDMDPAEWGEKWAAYQGGSGTATLTFTHTVVEPNISTQGIAVLANTLELNGGTIQSNGLAAQLAHTGLAHDSDHQVDWQQSDSESAANSAATGAPAITGTARVGETLTADTSGIADADGLTGASFSYQWLADNSDISGATGSTYAPANADVGKAVSVRVSFTDDAGHAETLTSAATAAVAAANPPEVTGVAVTSNPSSGDTYGLGEVIRISVTFDEAVDVTGAPQLSIDMDPAEWGKKQAAYESGRGTKALVFAHTVVEPNISTQGIAVLANTLALNGGDIESKATDTDADLSHTGLAHDSKHKVDWQQEEEGPGS